MSDQVSFTPQRALSSTIAASAGAKARFYQTGTVTPITVYADAAGTVPLAQPVVADAAGVFAQVFSTATTAVKAVVTAADDTALFTLDPCALTPTESGLASQVSVVPFTGVAATNVQAALQEIQANIGDQTTNAQTLVQTGGSANAYTLTPAVAITDYAQGQRFLARVNHTNTGAATLNVSGLGAKALQRYSDAGALEPLVVGALRVGDIAEVAYDGTRFVLLSSPVGANGVHVPLKAGSFTGQTETEIVCEVPAYCDEVQITLRNFLPSVSGDNLGLQVGTGTELSPTWQTTYSEIFYVATDGSITASQESPSAVSITPATSSTVHPNSSFVRVTGMNKAGFAEITASGGGTNALPTRVMSDVHGYQEDSATRTVLRIIPSSGTIDSLEYKIIGIRAL